MRPLYPGGHGSLLNGKGFLLRGPAGPGFGFRWFGELAGYGNWVTSFSFGNRKIMETSTCPEIAACLPQAFVKKRLRWLIAVLFLAVSPCTSVLGFSLLGAYAAWVGL